MSCVDGVVTLGATRTGANAFPNEHQFVIPTLHQNPGTPAVKTGDLCVIFDLANNNAAGAPASVTPAGFTAIGGAAGTQANGNGSRCNVSAKVLVTADIGATKVGMVGAENCRKMVVTFQMSRPVQAFTHGGILFSGPMGGNPANINVNDPGSAANRFLMGTMCADGTISRAGVARIGVVGSAYVSEVNDDIGGGDSATLAFYSFYPFGAPGANLSIDMPDASVDGANAAAVFFISVT